MVILALVMTRLKLSPADHRPLREKLPDALIAVVGGAGFGLFLLSIVQRPFDPVLSDFFERYCYAVSKNVGAMIDSPVRDRLGDLTQPVLVLFGERDRLIPNPYLHGGWTDDVAAIGREEIPGSEVLLLPECGHFVQFEKFEETNAAVLNFLD